MSKDRGQAYIPFDTHHTLTTLLDPRKEKNQ